MLKLVDDFLNFFIILNSSFLIRYIFFVLTLDS